MVQWIGGTPRVFRLTNDVFQNPDHDDNKEYIKKLIKLEIGNYSDINNFIHRSKAKNSRFFDWIGIDYLLREYERFLISKGNLIYYENLSKYKKFIPFDPDSRNRGFDDFPSGNLKRNFVYSLGNIFLSPQSRKNEEYEKMIKKIEKNGTNCEKEIIDRAYNADLIYERGVKILKFIEKRWDTELPFSRETEIKRILFDAQPKI